jgi:hypothetical protein
VFGELLSAAMVVGIFLILLGCLWVILKPDAPKQQTDRAWDMVKIIAGFFIGNLTSLLK